MLKENCPARVDGRGGSVRDHQPVAEFAQLCFRHQLRAVPQTQTVFVDEVDQDISEKHRFIRIAGALVLVSKSHMFAQGRQSLHHCDAGAMSMSIGDRMDAR